jgi:hypothetical protein
MSGLELRPRFKIESALSSDEIIQKINTAINDKEVPCNGSVITDYAVLKIPQDQLHFWSPQLSLNVSKQKEGSLISGLFAPSPAVWTMFMFFYMGIGVLGLFGMFYGLSQWTINKEPTMLWSVPVALLIELIIYLIAQTGKKLGNKQMHQLNSILEDVVK